MDYKQLLNENIFLNENYIIPEKNFEINIDNWKPGNPLWITGTSGDGKSTLSKKLASEYGAKIVHLDVFLTRISRSKEKYESSLNNTEDFINSIMIKEYIEQHPELPYGKDNSTWNNDNTDEIWNDLFDWLLKNAKDNPKYRRYLIIIEGCNICCMPPEKAITLPLIIIGCSRLQSSGRRIKRDMQGNHSLLDSIKREFERSKRYINDLNNTKDKFKKSLNNYLYEDNSFLNERFEARIASKKFFGKYITLYHGSSRLFKTLKNVGLDFGNAFQDPGWSLFNFRFKDRAAAWGAWVAICCINPERKYNGKIYKLPKIYFDNKVGRMFIKPKDKIKLINFLGDRKIPFYVYEYKIPIKEVGIGNDSRLDEYTVRKEIKDFKIYKMYISINNLNDYFIDFDEEEYEEYFQNNKNKVSNRGLMSYAFTRDFQHQDFNKIYSDICDKKLQPGDDIEEYMRNNNLSWKKTSFSDIKLNENLETTLTRPFLPKMVTLYRADKRKLKYIDPGKGMINIGTKLSKPRYSSWWCREEFFPICLVPYLKRVIYFIAKVPPFDGKNTKNNNLFFIDFINRKIYINKDIKKELNSFNENNSEIKKCYLYKVTVPRNIVGRGHNVKIDEYTIDEIIKPDKIETIKLSMYKPYIEYVDGETVKLYHRYYDNVSAAYMPTFMDKLIYYDTDTMVKRRRKNKKIQKEIKAELEKEK